MTKRLLFDTNAEQSVLGGLILDNRTWDFIEDQVSEKDFYHLQHQAIFKAISGLLTNEKPVDWLTLANKLKETKEFDAVGGDKYILDLLKGTPTAANIKHYASIVKRNSQERRLHLVALSILEMIEHSTEDALEKADRLLLSVQEDRINEPELISDNLHLLIQEIQTRKENQGKPSGLSTGYAQLDKITKGLKKANLVVLAARPSMGKTQLVMNIAQHVSYETDKAVLFFSMEMTAEELKLRVLSSLSSVDNDKLADGTFTDADEIKIAEALKEFSKLKLFLDGSDTLTISDIRARSRRMKRKEGLSLIVVDYLGLIKGIGENETVRISNISRGLKALAKELDVPVLALSQLNRGLETRDNKRPMMADLRQSGQIEQDADIVMFIYRHAIYNEQMPDHEKDISEVIISKNRSGQLGKVYLKFNGANSRFEDYQGVVPSYSSDNISKGTTRGFKLNDKFKNNIYND